MSEIMKLRFELAEIRELAVRYDAEVKEPERGLNRRVQQVGQVVFLCSLPGVARPHERLLDRLRAALRPREVGPLGKPIYTTPCTECRTITGGSS